MSIYRSLLAGLLLAALLSPNAQAFDSTKATTQSGNAWATLRKAVRHGDAVAIDIRFETDYAGYSGEILYDDLPDATLDKAIHLSAGGADYPLLRENGKAAAPEELKLKFNYNPLKNPRVGDWKARFVAPPADAQDVFLILPNVAPIGPIAIKNQ